MNCPFHYEVRLTNIRYISKDNIDFNISKKSFIDDNPLVSRQKSLDFYVDYISGLLEHLGLEYQSDRQSREILKSYIESGNTDIIITRDHEDDISKSIFYGIGVFLVYDKRKEENKKHDIENLDIDEEIKELIQIVVDNPIIVEEQLIHGFGNYGSTEILPDNFIDDLWFETGIYRKNGIDIDNLTINVDFYDDELQEFDTLEILPTPFDWSGYDVPRKQEEPKKKIEKPQPEITIEQIIKDGETDQVEFKSTLKFNIDTKKGDSLMTFNIGKTICGFLNSNGGFLFIGIDDEGNPIGLSYDFSLSGGKNPKDYFRREFDNMLEKYLPQWVQDNLIVNFYEYKGVEIFIVSVSQSETQPVFLKGQQGKEFYIRRTGSTKQLDVEDFLYYWKNHWKKEE